MKRELLKQLDAIRFPEILLASTRTAMGSTPATATRTARSTGWTASRTTRRSRPRASTWPNLSHWT